MALQRAHIQLGVSVQVVLQQSLVDEGVLHLRRKTVSKEKKKKKKRKVALVYQIKAFLTILASYPRLFFQLVYATTRAEESSRAVSPRCGGSDRVNTYICLDELTALLSDSAHRAEHIHPLFHVHHVDHAVNDNERPGPPNSSTVEKATRSSCNNKHKSGYRKTRRSTPT